VALVGRVIASHYAEPVGRTVVGSAQFRAAPNEDSEIIGELSEGEPFELLDESLGWAWGYAGKERRVGYVLSEALQ